MKFLSLKKYCYVLFLSRAKEMRYMYVWTDKLCTNFNDIVNEAPTGILNDLQKIGFMPHSYTKVENAQGSVNFLKKLFIVDYIKSQE